MSKFILKGGNKLNGTVRVSGNKNAVLPCLAACLLTDREVVLENCPKISDVLVMVEILKRLGAEVVMEDHTITVKASKVETTELPLELTNKLRGSVLLAGAMLGRKGQVTFSHPGGDVIGRRSLEQHTDGFEKLGFGVESTDRKYVVKKAHQGFSDVHMFLELPTVTGTENLVLCAVLRKGKTVLRNAAQEPHVVDLCNLLNKMGAQISGVGTNKLEIEGVESLGGAEFRIGADPIEFGTYSVAAAITGGEVKLENCEELDTEPITWALEKMGMRFEKIDDGYKVSAGELKAISTNFPFTANFWPGFPTDLMSVMIVLATQAQGVSVLRDFLYESRMFFVDKLIAMGAQITIADPHRVLVSGPSQLHGREQETPDIRAGMALVLAGLVAQGDSVINRAELIERGYENAVENLKSLGAEIRKEE